MERAITRRGIEPPLLLDQVRSGAPYVLETEWPAEPRLSYLKRLQDFKGEALTLVQQFHLYLCAHWATAGCYVPTDVDNAIRLKNWKIEEITEGDMLAMADWTIESVAWDYRPVTARLARLGDEVVATHEGTWFSVAVGAYAALKDRAPAKAKELFATIMTEAEREARFFRELYASGDAIETLKATALLAHNFGDLDRVADMWELRADDPLMKAVYDAAKPGSRLFGGWLGFAGDVNQRFMAPENHRHFALRAARNLRAKPSLLLPVGPFYDAWGNTVAKEPPEVVGEVVRALIDGWQYQKVKAAGYPRALAGILEAFPGGMQKLEGFIPGKDARTIKSGPLRAAASVPRSRFEAQWANSLRRVTPPK